MKNNLICTFSIACVFLLFFSVISCSGSSENKEKAAGIERFEADGKKSYFGRIREESKAKKTFEALEEYEEYNKIYWGRVTDKDILHREGKYYPLEEERRTFDYYVVEVDNSHLVKVSEGQYQRIKFGDIIYFKKTNRKEVNDEERDIFPSAYIVNYY